MISRRRFITGCAAVSMGAAVRSPLSWALDCERALGDPTSKGSFVRIFPNASQSLNNSDGEQALRLLAQAMMSGQPRPNASRLFPGYTYLGQFIDHDLTWNRVPFDDPFEKQEGAQNFRSSFLDLDSVYGNGPPLACQFTGPVEAESFILGETAPSPALDLKGGSLNDVPFDESRPIIGDRLDLRNAENLIVRQIHVIFLKVHNKVIAELPNHSEDADVPHEGNLFERARRLVTWTYQWLVWNDFLASIRGTGFRDPQRLEHPSGSYQLPLEFVLSGFRFGHSMAQNDYAFNCHHKFPDTPVRLWQLMNSSEKFAFRLTEEHVIDWRHFFDGLPQGRDRVIPIKASSIDTHLPPALGNLSPQAVLNFSEASKGQESQNLAYRSLLRSAKAEIAFGQQVRQVLRDKGKTVADISAALKNDEALKATGFTDNTPLWYYILKEAEVAPRYGDRLGDVGIYIVERGLEEALQHDPKSYLSQRGNQWKPPSWILRNPHFASLIKFAGATVPEGCNRR